MIRRVVTGYDQYGKSTVLLDESSPRSNEFQHVPGFVTTLVWGTEAQAVIPAVEDDPAASALNWVPELGATRAMVITFPPDAVFMTKSFNADAAVAEYAEVLPGLAESFEPDHPGMHTTDTIDYGVVLDGEIMLELDDGCTQVLGKNDVIVQQGTRHAWRNPGPLPATVFFVLVGARRR